MHAQAKWIIGEANRYIKEEKYANHGTLVENRKINKVNIMIDELLAKSYVE